MTQPVASGATAQPNASDVADLNAAVASTPPSAAAFNPAPLPDNHVVADFAAARARAQAGDPVAELNAAFGAGASGAPGAAATPPAGTAPANDDLPLGKRIEAALGRLADQMVTRPIAEANAGAAQDLSEAKQRLDEFSDNDRDIVERTLALGKAALAAGDFATAGPLVRAVLANYVTRPIAPAVDAAMPHKNVWGQPMRYDPDQFAGDLGALAQVYVGMGGEAGGAARVAGDGEAAAGEGGEIARSGVPGSPEPDSVPPEIARGDARYVTLGNKQYVAHADGSTGFGAIPDEVAAKIGVRPGSILLPQGSARTTGELHMIRGGKAAELKAAGYDDVGQLVDDVGRNFNQVYQGTGDSLILVKRATDPKSPMMFVEISHASGGPAWEVKSGGVFDGAYTDGKTLLWSREQPGTPTGENVPLGDQPGPGDAGGASGNATGQNSETSVPPADGGVERLARIGDLWRMSRDDLEGRLEEKGLSDDAKLARALGDEGAATWKGLQRTANSALSSPASRAAAQAELDRIESTLTPAQERLMFGIGETDAQAEDIKAVLDAHEPYEGETRERIAWDATLGLRRVAPDDILAVPKGNASPAAQAAYVRLMRGYGELVNQGVRPDEIPDLLVRGMSEGSGMSPSNAAEFIGEFLEKAKAGRRGGASSGAAKMLPEMDAGGSAARGLREAEAAPAPEPPVMGRSSDPRFPDAAHQQLYDYGRSLLEGGTPDPATRQRLFATLKGYVENDPESGQPFARPEDVDQTARDYADPQHGEPGGSVIDPEVAPAYWQRQANAGGPARQPPAPFHLVGQAGERLRTTPELGRQARAWANGESGANPVQASLEALSGDGALDDAIKRAASFIPPGAVKSDESLRMGAYTVQMSPEDVLAGFKGRMPTDEQVAAMGMLVSSAGREAWAAARRAVAEGTPEAWEQANRAYALMNKVVGEWSATGSEQGRAFRARQLTWESRDDYTRAFQQVVADVGADNVEQAVRGLAAMDDPAKAAPYVSALRKYLGRDGLLFARYNMLLSNPATVVKKVASDVTVGMWNLAVRKVAEEFGSGAVQAGETAALFQGYTGSMGDAIVAAGKALRAGRSQFEADYQSMDGITRSRLSMLANGAPEALPADQPSAAALSYLRSALPTSWIGAADDFAKVANYRAELRALAWRDGSAKGLEDDALTQHVNGILNNPPMALHEQARAAALANTFQEPLTGIAAKVSDLADSLNLPVGRGGYSVPVGRIILPFVKVPANIMKFAYRNGPLPLAFKTDGYLAELAAGGARRDIARARVGLGTAVSLIAAPLAVMGAITGGGPGDPDMQRAWRAAGNQPYSVKFGDTWYQYNRLEPLGQMLGPIADTVDIVKFAHDQDAEQAALSLAFGMGNSMLSKTYMTGLSDFLAALRSPDRDAKRYFENLATSFVVPQGAAGLARASDPWMRSHYDLLDAIAARIPGWGSAKLPPARDLWGDPIPWKDAFLPPISGTGAARMLSPVATTDSTRVEPIDKWIWDNRAAFPQGEDGRLGLAKPNKLVQHFDAGPGLSAQVKLDPWQLDRYQELAGNGLKDPRTGLGAKDTLNALVTGNHPDAAMQAEWDRATPSARALMVQHVANTFRNRSKRQLLTEFPDIGDAVRAGLQQRAAQVGGGAAAAAQAMPNIGGN